MNTVIKCSCGHQQPPDAMKKIGYQDMANAGEWALLANCVKCGSTCTIEILTNACQCATCRRIVTGTVDDPKIAVDDDAEGPMLLCAGCYRRDPRKMKWTSHDRFAGPDSWRMLRDVSAPAVAS